MLGVTVEAISQEVINGNHCFMRIIRMIDEQKGGHSNSLTNRTAGGGGAEVDAGGQSTERQLICT